MRRVSHGPRLTGGLFALAESKPRVDADSDYPRSQPQPRALGRLEHDHDPGRDTSEDEGETKQSRGCASQARNPRRLQQVDVTRKRCTHRFVPVTQDNMELQVPASANLLGYLRRIQDELRTVVAQPEPLIPCDQFLDEPKHSDGKGGELQDGAVDQDINTQHAFQTCSAHHQESRCEPGVTLHDIARHPSSNTRGQAQPSLSKVLGDDEVAGRDRAAMIFSFDAVDAEPCDVLCRKNSAQARSRSVHRRRPLCKDFGSEATLASGLALDIHEEASASSTTKWQDGRDRETLAIEDMHDVSMARRQGGYEVVSHDSSICKHQGLHSALLVSGGGTPHTRMKHWDFTSDLTFLASGM